MVKHLINASRIPPDDRLFAASVDDPLSNTIAVITRIAIERAKAHQRLISASLSKILKSQSEKMKARRHDLGLSRAAGQW